MFLLTFDVEITYGLNPNLEPEENREIWLEETLVSVGQITRILKWHQVPVTFFMVGKVVKRAEKELADLLLDDLLFDIWSHTTAIWEF